MRSQSCHRESSGGTGVSNGIAQLKMFAERDGERSAEDIPRRGAIDRIHSECRNKLRTLRAAEISTSGAQGDNDSLDTLIA